MTTPTTPPPVVVATLTHIDGKVTRSADIVLATPPWSELLGWLRAHDVDPMEIPIDEELVIDVTRQRITYTTWKRDRRSKARLIDEDGTGRTFATKRATRTGPIAPLPPALDEALS